MVKRKLQLDGESLKKTRKKNNGDVAELADAVGSSPAVFGHVGSNPSIPTNTEVSGEK